MPKSSCARCWATPRVTLADLLNLKPGDVLPCDFNGKVTLLAEDVPVFRGSFGVSRGQQAVKIERAPAPRQGRRTRTPD